MTQAQRESGKTKGPAPRLEQLHLLFALLSTAALAGDQEACAAQNGKKGTRGHCQELAAVALLQHCPTKDF
ncbi:hypothetical protein IVA79_07045 [Bradyrhizobium sp. 138]|uniref:hypothetical protein n=1 Tax=Bradyrhizobium sp. 138 TaxID=2782615 RepID=UPI001FF7A5EC|nr:hypothetical protein [Bradyrhizobium sp. 138]MCK1733721.1 hypothetical protein [Bradyrhizobium sp. 138]